MYGRPRLLPSLAGLAPAAWYRFGQGITSAGGLVSQWDDQSGNARHLLQAVGANQPTLQADGSILFDGIDNFLQTAAFAFIQPVTWYLLARQITWTNGDHVMNGVGANVAIFQSTASPQIQMFAGNSTAINANWHLNTYNAVCAIFNGANSLMQIGNSTPTTGNSGASNPDGFTLATINSAVSGWANIQAKEAIIFPAAHNANQRGMIISYLRNL